MTRRERVWDHERRRWVRPGDKGNRALLVLTLALIGLTAWGAAVLARLVVRTVAGIFT